MSNKLEHYFWDSCVFTAFLKDERAAYNVDDIACFLDDVKKGNARIYTSSIALAEVLPSHLKKGSFDDFLDEFQSMVITVEPSINIMKRACILRDIKYSKSTSNKRSLGVADSIMLSTCLELKEAFGVDIKAFHTYDNGKKRSEEEGRSIPLLTYETWCENLPDKCSVVAKKVIELKREKPIYPTPKFI